MSRTIRRRLSAKRDSEALDDWYGTDELDASESLFAKSLERLT